MPHAGGRHRCRRLKPKPQFMQPLTGVGHQPTTAWQINRGIGRISIAQPDQTVEHPWGKGKIRRSGQLLLKELVKALLTSLDIAESLIRLQIQCLLQRAQPGEQTLQLRAI